MVLLELGRVFYTRVTNKLFENFFHREKNESTVEKDKSHLIILK